VFLSAQDVVRWTIRLALVCLTAALCLEWETTGDRWRRAANLIWTAGCALVWMHLITAIRYHHGGSFSQAAAETSRRTAEVLGWSPGGEIYVNLAFAVVWTFDAAWRWAAPDSWRGRSQLLSAAITAFLLFIAFNATVVFERGVVRWAGIAVSLLLATSFARGVYARRRETAAATQP
jgi:hypothetical protein